MNKLGLPKITFAQKVIMGSIIGNTIDYWGGGGGRGSKRPAAHNQQKLTQVPPVPAASNVT